MKAQMRTALVCLSMLVLAACATTDEQTADAASTGSVPAMTADEAYIAYVEELARRRGIEVVWVNAPTIPAEVESD